MKISICAIVKDEKDLIEWIIYHKLIGFDHFYIYDNNDSPLKLNFEFCTVVRFPGSFVQIEAYKHYLSNFSQQSDYVCVIDADEYVVINGKNILESISKFPDHDAIVLNWKNFVNLNEKRSDGLLFDVVRHWQVTKNGYSPVIKTISKTKNLIDIDNPHYFIYNKEAKVLGADFLEQKDDKLLHNLIKEPIIWINHYYIKSLKEFKFKCEVRGRAVSGSGKCFLDELSPFKRITSKSTPILNWVEKVKNEKNKYFGEN
jgi:hypothetical protein